MSKTKKSKNTHIDINLMYPMKKKRYKNVSDKFCNAFPRDLTLAFVFLPVISVIS